MMGARVGHVVADPIQLALLDLVKQRERQGIATRDALLIGGRIRVRPILMTAAATILATLPLALGGGDGSFIAAELGTVIIGGLLSSTLLTLLVIPVLYSLASGMKRRLGFRIALDEDQANGIPLEPEALPVPVLSERHGAVAGEGEG